YKSGFVAVVGRPNVGKSTLLNQIIGQKIAIVSDTPQTTRNRILGILTLPDAQILFLDTPGIHKPQHKLGEYMVNSARSALREVDLILFVSDVTESVGPGERFILDMLKQEQTPVILVLNKVDLVAKDKLLPIISQYSAFRDFAAIVPVSALAGSNVDRLLSVIKDLLPEGPQYYPEDEVTDQPERVVAAEFIREKIFRLTREEIPHSTAVEVEEMKTRPNGDVFLRATIYVERESQKGIIIGAKGAMLKEIGQQARLDMENIFGSRFFVDLWVKVKNDWRNKEGSLRMFGYDKNDNR
ncbi:MAG: GTPase Era, partial [Negativicutes bacterium]|nr:GTPase Era [Negativicutes bacterium]